MRYLSERSQIYSEGHNMATEGDIAPAFDLPGITDRTFNTFSLTDALDQDHAVLL